MPLRDVHPTNEICVAVGIVQDAGRLLICRRPPRVPLGNFWEFPGGKLEPGETPDAAVVREIREETGLVVAVVGELSSFTHTYPHGRIRIIPRLCCRVSGEAQPLQCVECRWILPRDVLLYEFPSANAGLLAQILEHALQTPADAVNLPGSGD